MDDTFAIVGSGHLAWHLSQLLEGPVVVVSRSGSPADWPVPIITHRELANYHLKAVFLAVPDNAIAGVSRRLSEILPPTLPVYHTSGATPLDRIDPYFTERGVLWPIRSLRLGEPVSDWRDLPLVVYASTTSTRTLITAVARALSDTVAYLDDEQRAQLHLAAVFSNNFVTALYDVAHRLCQQADVPFDLLLPIMRHTAAQQDGTPPRDRQTGAAARGDTATIDRHLALITVPAYRDIYRSLTDLILQYRLPEHNADLRRDADDDLQDEGIA
ncbi:hypothetical protein LEM8419_03091 [Neolewinella maritima]|uniref:DUF2520 domain-containing protein n=1 Tax=Neolewinella maritima TaxID=1383882 RepID=A0ABN8FD03_9BACT|nr:DUF2520 domain-containing protein [Neolewinella maritima]CAH1002174.1 hypothetical protein LEM8419_03091 [Neolewinella maritima]